MSSPVRIPDNVHAETKRLAALRGESPGDLLAAAWAEYVDRHGAEFADELIEAAQVLRDGTRTDVAAYLSRSATDRAARSVAADAYEPAHQ